MNKGPYLFAGSNFLRLIEVISGKTVSLLVVLMKHNLYYTSNFFLLFAQLAV